MKCRYKFVFLSENEEYEVIEEASTLKAGYAFAIEDLKNSFPSCKFSCILINRRKL